MAHGSIPDKPEQLVAETEMVLTATAASEDFASAMESISINAGATPEQIACLEERVLALAPEQSSWRKHPLRRLNAKRQDAQIALGELLLACFPFIRPPAEWLNHKLE